MNNETENVNDESSCKILAVGQPLVEIMPNENNYEELQATAQEWLKTGKDENKKDAVKNGISIVAELSKEYEKFDMLTGAGKVHKAILLGRMLNGIKPLVKKPGQKWEDWAMKNVDFNNKRNRQKFMRIASFKGVENYACLGIDRLGYLCAVIDESTEDPIGTLLTKYGLQTCSDKAEELEDFKVCVDLAIAAERLEMEKIDFGFDHVEHLHSCGVKFNKTLIGKLKEIKGAKGDTKHYLENMSANIGNTQSGTKGTLMKVEDFNSLGKRIIRAIDYMLGKPDTSDTLDKGMIADLEAKIIALKAASNIS